MKDSLEYYIFLFFIWLVQKLPQKWVPSLGKGFGLLFYYLGIRRNVVLKNLEIAFGNKITEEGRRQLLKKIYLNAGRVFFEILLMYSISPQELDQYIEFDGLDVLEEAMKEGKGVVLAGGHFGHWELMSAGISTFGTPMNGYAGKQRNDRFDKTLNEVRRKFGMKTISKSKTSARLMIKALRNKELLGILGDLNVQHDNLFVDFFGIPAAFGQGLPTLALKFDTPLLFAWNVRVGPLRHKASIIRLHYEPANSDEETIQNIAQLIASQLERVIQEHPDQYFWFNKRWKKRPPEEKEPIVSY